MNVEQRAAIKFCVRNGFSRIRIIEYMTNAYGDTAPKKQQSTSGLSALKKDENP